MAYLSAWGLHKAINTFCCSPPVLQTCWAVQKGKRGNLFASLRPFIPSAPSVCTHTDKQTVERGNINDLFRLAVLYLDPVGMYLAWIAGNNWQLSASEIHQKWPLMTVYHMPVHNFEILQKNCNNHWNRLKSKTSKCAYSYDSYNMSYLVANVTVSDGFAPCTQQSWWSST